MMNEINTSTTTKKENYKAGFYAFVIYTYLEREREREKLSFIILHQ